MPGLASNPAPLYRVDITPPAVLPVVAPPATRWSILLANLKKLIHDVAADPLGVDPTKSGPAGLINPSAIFKSLLVGVLTMLGSWGGLALVWGWTHLGAVLLPPPVFLALTFCFGLVLKLRNQFRHGSAPVPAPTPVPTPLPLPTSTSVPILLPTPTPVP